MRPDPWRQVLAVLCMAVAGAWRMRDGGSTMLAVWMLLSFPIVQEDSHADHLA